VEQDVVESLSLHAGFLASHLELDVGGNHLVKNLKALIGLGVFLGDERLVDQASRRLERQLPIQVLEDGGHFERSPSYHCQVLGDLLDVAELLQEAGSPPVHGLHDATTAMRRWLGVMLLPDGDVPLFNDCVLVGDERLRLLDPLPPDPSPISVLGPSGYVVARKGPFHLVADVGEPCPPDLPAHAHADTLSFELAVDGRRTVVDTGTSTYEPGARRQQERSTRAHNTVEIDGEDSTEVWGAFRAGRRARATLECAAEADGAVEVVARHEGYRHLTGSPVHRRSWRVTEEAVEITDEILGEGSHAVRGRLHLSPAVPPPVVTVRGAQLDRQQRAEVASGFGCRLPTGVLVMDASGVLPLRSVLRLTPPDHHDI
jgi:uncharacterized heparinase superfamily protein